MSAIDRLIRGLGLLETADTVLTLESVLAFIGLYNDGREMYGVWEPFKNPRFAPGLWQNPTEFAAFLHHLASKTDCRTVLEVGTFHGYSSLVMYRYLRRFRPVQVVTLDVAEKVPGFVRDQMKGVIYLHHTSTTEIHPGHHDLAFIDADHTYGAVKRDYENLKDCGVVAFHDINDHCVRDDCPDGGVWKFWREVRETRPYREFSYSDKWMGIGVVE